MKVSAGVRSWFGLGRPSFRALGLLSILVVGCAGGAPRGAENPKENLQVEPAAQGTGSQLEPLTAEEQALSQALKADVEQLARLSCHQSSRTKQETCGRNLNSPWELAAVADWLSGRMEELGYQINRQGIELPSGSVMNLEAEVPGGHLAKEWVVIGAAYDSAQGSPGANGNASGVAALLALAKSFQSRPHQRGIRFVFFANREHPFAKTREMGSAVYAKKLSGLGERVSAMLSLESLGYYSDAEGSQRFNEPQLAAAHPGRGNFVAVWGQEASAALVQTSSKLLKQHASLPVIPFVFPAKLSHSGEFLPLNEAQLELPASAPEAERGSWLGFSDHWAFEQFGFPAVLITDTGAARYPEHRSVEDLPGRLDYGRLARVVSGLEALIVGLARGPHLT